MREDVNKKTRLLLNVQMYTIKNSSSFYFIMTTINLAVALKQLSLNDSKYSKYSKITLKLKILYNNFGNFMCLVMKHTFPHISFNFRVLRTKNTNYVGLFILTTTFSFF